MAAIETHNLAIGYRLRRGACNVVHQRLDLELKEGALTCLLGLNGAGKSTLLRTLCGLQPALGGEINISGRNLQTYSQSELSRILGVVLTERTNAGGITVYEMVSLGRYPHTGFFGQLNGTDHDIVKSAIAAVGLTTKEGSHVSELSDGERQKAFIAKALAQECPIIILDEPTAFLDVASRIEILALLKNLAAVQHKTILLSTHDLDSALQMADELWLQQPDEPMKCGSPQQMISDGTLESFFSRGGVRFDPEQCRIVPEI